MKMNLKYQKISHPVINKKQTFTVYKLTDDERQWDEGSYQILTIEETIYMCNYYIIYSTCVIQFTPNLTFVFDTSTR